MFLAPKRNNIVRNLEQIWLRNLIRVCVAHIDINSDRNKTELLYDAVNLAFPTTYNLLQNIFEKVKKTSQIVNSKKTLTCCCVILNASAEHLFMEGRLGIRRHP